MRDDLYKTERLRLDRPFFFVTVGSTDFDLLIKSVDELLPDLGKIGGVMQIGHGRYCPHHLPHFRFASSLEPYYEQATLVIAHGGLGITMEVLNRGLPLVSVSNKDRYDNHQDDLLGLMAEEGYLSWCRQIQDLPTTIEQALATSHRPYGIPDCTIHEKIHDFLESIK